VRSRRVILGVILIVALALALGAIAGHAFRRFRSPTLEERAHDVAEEVKSAIEKITH